MEFYKALPNLTVGRHYAACSSFGTNIVMAGGCLDIHRCLYIDDDSLLTDSVEVLDLSSSIGWREQPKLVNRIRNMVMVNVRSTLVMVGGLFRGLDQIETFHNTSIENKYTKLFEKTQVVGLKKYRQDGHSVVPVDTDFFTTK